MFNFTHMESVTEKIKRKIGNKEITIKELSESLGVTRNTIYTRLQKGNWKKGELIILRTI